MPDGLTAPLPDETNPYASPKAPVDPDWKGAEQIEGAWRRGDEMLLAGGKSMTPRACWVSNRSWRIHPNTLASAPKRVIIPMIFLLGVPLLGLLLVCLLALLNALFRWFPWVRCWLRLGLDLWYEAGEGVACILVGSGCVGANVGGLMLCAAWEIGLLPGLIAYAAALLVLTAGIALSAVLPRAILGLAVERQEDGLVHVRGVHPDYLARLPEYPGEQRRDLSSQAAEAAPGSEHSPARWPAG